MVGGESQACFVITLPDPLAPSPLLLTYLDPRKEGHPPWEGPLWPQQLPGPPESVGPVGEEIGVRGLPSCPGWLTLGGQSFILCILRGAGYLSTSSLSYNVTFQGGFGDHTSKNCP